MIDTTVLILYSPLIIPIIGIFIVGVILFHTCILPIPYHRLKRYRVVKVDTWYYIECKYIFVFTKDYIPWYDNSYTFFKFSKPVNTNGFFELEQAVETISYLKTINEQKYQNLKKDSYYYKKSTICYED